MENELNVERHEIKSTDIDLSSSQYVDDMMKLLLCAVYDYPSDDLVKEPVSSKQARTIGELVNSLIECKIMTTFESFKFRRFKKINDKAKVVLKGRNNQIGTIIAGDHFEYHTHIDFDWYYKLFEYATGTSKDVLQDIWAKILANEIQHPNSCSLRTLDVVSKMSVSEALSFLKLCKLIVSCEGDYFVFDAGFLEASEDNVLCSSIIVKEELNYEKDIVSLQECGLISLDNRSIAFSVPNPAHTELPLSSDQQAYRVRIGCLAFEMDFQDYIKTRSLKDSDKANIVLFNEEVYFLTSSGIELYHSLINAGSINHNENIEYILACFLFFEKKYKRMKLEIYLKDKTGDTYSHVLSRLRRELEQSGIKEADINDEILVQFLEQIIKQEGLK